jgi:hypothetical protein
MWPSGRCGDSVLRLSRLRVPHRNAEYRVSAATAILVGCLLVTVKRGRVLRGHPVYRVFRVARRQANGRQHVFRGCRCSRRRRCRCWWAASCCERHLVDIRSIVFRVRSERRLAGTDRARRADRVFIKTWRSCARRDMHRWRARVGEGWLNSLILPNSASFCLS